MTIEIGSAIAGAAMIGMGSYGVAVFAGGLRKGEKRIKIGYGRTFIVTLADNPTQFWVYSAVDIAFIGIAAVFATHFLTGLI